MKYIRILFDDESHYLESPENIGDAISREIESLLEGDYSKITLSVVEMTEEEYNKLPEFEG